MPATTVAMLWAHLAVLIDRDHRELPIRADYVPTLASSGSRNTT